MLQSYVKHHQVGYTLGDKQVLNYSLFMKSTSYAILEAMCLTFDDDNTKQNIKKKMKRVVAFGLWEKEKEEEETKVLDNYYVTIPYL